MKTEEKLRELSWGPTWFASNFLDLLHLKCAKNAILTLQFVDVKLNGLIYLSNACSVVF